MKIEILNDYMRLSPTLVSEQNIYEYVLKLNCSLTIELCYRNTYTYSIKQRDSTSF